MDSESPFSEHLDTNYVPTPLDIEQIDDLIRHRQAILDEVEGVLLELNRVRNAVEAKKSLHTKYIARHRALTSIVRRLPADVLSSIFMAFLSLFPPHSSPHPSVTISHVCRQWRNLALELPLLWTQIEASNHQLTATFVSRAGDCPLDVSLTSHDGDNAACERLASIIAEEEAFYRPIVDALTLCKDNGWDVLRLHLRVNPSLPLSLTWAMVPASCGRTLREIILDISCSNGRATQEGHWAGMDGAIDLREVPFTRLTARMAPLDLRRVHAPWDVLTDLTLGPPTDDTLFKPTHALDILDLTPNLLHLAVKFTNPSSILSVVENLVPPLASNRNICLTKLQSLTILSDSHTLEFTSALRLPSLRCLSVRPNGIPRLEEIDFCGIVDIVQRCGDQLIDVSLDYQSLTQPSLEYVLEHLPTVESLTLNTGNRGVAIPDAQEGDPDLILAALEPLLAKLIPGILHGTSSEACLCPRLTNFICGMSECTGGIRGDLVYLIRARRDTNLIGGPVRLLERITVGFDRESSCGLEDIREDLEHLGVDTRGVELKVRGHHRESRIVSFEAL